MRVLGSSSSVWEEEVTAAGVLEREQGPGWLASWWAGNTSMNHQSKAMGAEGARLFLSCCLFDCLPSCSSMEGLLCVWL